MSGTILIVDDEEPIRTVLAEFFQERGHNAFEANSIAAARKHLRSGLRPDVVVLDVMLQDGSGASFVPELRSSLAPHHVPVVLISAHRTSSKDRVSGLETGADDYLTKPFDLRELAIRVERLMNPRSSRESGKGVASRAEAEVSEILQVILTKPGQPDDLGLPPPPVAPGSKSDSATRAPTPTAATPAAAAAVTAPIPTLPASANDDLEIEEQHDRSSFRQLLHKFLAVVLNPFSALANLADHERRALGIAVPIAAGIFAGAQEGLEAASLGSGLVNAVMISLGYLICTSFLGWMIQWGLGLRQKRVLFKRVFEALGLSLAPMALAALLGALYVGFASGRAGDFTAGPLLAFPSQASSKYFGFLLRRIDLFELWTVWLAAHSLHHAIGARRMVAMAWCFSVWGIALIAGTAVAGMFR
jgi:CheY-like chemotaxis protein